MPQQPLNIMMADKNFVKSFVSHWQIWSFAIRIRLVFCGNVLHKFVYLMPQL